MPNSKVRVLEKWSTKNEVCLTVFIPHQLFHYIFFLVCIHTTFTCLKYVYRQHGFFNPRGAATHYEVFAVNSIFFFFYFLFWVGKTERNEEKKWWKARNERCWSKEQIADNIFMPWNCKNRQVIQDNAWSARYVCKFLIFPRPKVGEGAIMLEVGL